MRVYFPIEDILNDTILGMSNVNKDTWDVVINSFSTKESEV